MPNSWGLGFTPNPFVKILIREFSIHPFPSIYPVQGHWWAGVYPSPEQVANLS